MDAPFLPYLQLLRELAGKLDQLGQYAQEKITAVGNDDLMALDEVLKKEQVMGLSLRGLEQKRKTLLDQLKLGDVPLSDLSKHYPESLAMEAKEAAARYGGSVDLVNLHQIEKVITAAGIDPVAGSGYDAPGVEPPKNMKSDFRA